MKKIVIGLLVLIVCYSTQVYSQQFIEQSGISIQGLAGTADLGDYNNDGYLDLLLTGWTGYNGVTTLYKNNGNNTFTEQTSINLTYVDHGSAKWGDYNNDGNLDILLTGTRISKIYKNNGNGTFSNQSNIVLPNVNNSCATWGDYNNDGFLDFVIIGTSSNNPISKIFKNNGDNTFSEQIGISLIGVQDGDAKWADFNNDGNLDLLISGLTSSSSKVTKLYLNNGNNTFVELSPNPFIGLWYSSIAWGDYNNDGYLDVLLTGRTSTDNRVTKVYKNNGNNTFTDQTGIVITGVSSGSSCWGDYDNDGDLDILVSGNTDISNGQISKIYKNNGNNTFSEQTGISLASVAGSSICGDYDNDGDLDIYLSGFNFSSNSYSSKLYKNTILTTNNPPASPLILLFDSINGKFSWNKGFDDHTMSSNILSNIMIGTANNRNKYYASHSENIGFRKIVSLGNQFLDTVFSISNCNLPFDSSLIFSVQSIDNSFISSTFKTKYFTLSPKIEIISSDTLLECGDTINLDVSCLNGDASTLTYLWTPAIGLSNPTIKNPKLNTSISSWYKVISTSPLGLQSVDSIYIQAINANHQINFTSNQTVLSAPPFDFQFFNNTPNFNNYNYKWDFGDSIVIASNNQNVNHTYLYNGVYNVSLIAIEKVTFCEDTLKKLAFIQCSGGPNLNLNPNLNKIPDFTIFPNPNHGDFNIVWNENFVTDFTIKIIDIYGSVIFENTVKNFQKNFNFHLISKGLYFFTIQTESDCFVKKIIVE